MLYYTATFILTIYYSALVYSVILINYNMLPYYFILFDALYSTLYHTGSENVSTLLYYTIPLYHLGSNNDFFFLLLKKCMRFCKKKKKNPMNFNVVPITL